MLCEVPSVDDVLLKAKDEFFNVYKEEPEMAVCAPARINIMGDHSEYNDGFILPIALPFVTVIVGRKNGLPMCRIATLADLESDNDGSIISFKLPSKHRRTFRSGSPQWANYIKGVVSGFPGDFMPFDILVNASVPIDSGLASSSSLEVAMFTFLEELSGTKVDYREKALVCQKAETEVAGLPCGATDQLASTLGRAGHAILIDCMLFTFRLIPFTTNSLVFIVTDSNVKHKPVECDYTIIKAQCLDAALLMGEPSLRHATVKKLDTLSNLNVEVQMIDRAEHIIMETIRTQEAAYAMERGDFEKLGQLMNESHDSLRDLYKVSCKELDSLVDIARSVPGVLGSRMTGDGFGGCTVTLLHEEATERYMFAILESYDRAASFYVCRPADGPRSLKLETSK